MKEERNWREGTSRGLQAVAAFLIVCGLSYCAVQGWGGMFWPVVSVIIAIALAAPFIFLTHRVVQGCWISGLLMLLVLTFLSAEGGLTFCEGLKHSESSRFAKLESTSLAEQKKSELQEANSTLSAERAAADEASKEVGSLKSRIASIALLTPAEVTAHIEVKTRLETLLASISAERSTGTGDNYWKGIEAATKKGKSHYQGNADVAEAEVKTILSLAAEAIRSNDQRTAELETLKSELGGAESVLAVKQGRLQEVQSKVSSIEIAKNTNAEKASVLEEVQHTIFAKASHWAGGDENKTINYLFWLGFALNATVNLTAGFWLAMVTVSDNRKMKAFVLHKIEPKQFELVEEAAEPEPEKETEENVIEITSSQAWLAQKAARKNPLEIKAENLEKARELLDINPQMRTVHLATTLGISEATARNYKNEVRKTKKGNRLVLAG